MKNKYQKLFVTGGHITPAIALIDELKRIHPDWKIILVGRNALEARLSAEKKIDFLLLSRVPIGFIQAFGYCLREKPDCIVSFGSYVAVPVCIAAWIFRVPIITHEQTRVPGLANKLIARIARRICVTFPDSFNRFPKEKTVVTGLPVRKEILHPPTSPPIPVDDTRPLLYITGGSTGAVSLNDIILPILPNILKRYTVVHQTGKLSLARARDIHSAHYIARNFFDVHIVAWILSHAKLVVARSGANTVMELAILNTRAICIPLPWSAGGEQLANAQWLARRGNAAVYWQDTVTPETLLVAIDDAIQRPLMPVHTHDTILLNGANRMAVEIDAILG